MKILDFHFEGGGRWSALRSLYRHYPNYSLARIILKCFNGLNQIGPKKLPYNHSRLIESCTLPHRKEDESFMLLLHKLDQTGRAYLFHYDKNMTLGYVTKIAISEAGAIGIRKEAKFLEQLADTAEFKIPSVVNFKNWKDGCMLTISAATREYQTFDKKNPLPDFVFDSLSKLEKSSGKKLQVARLIEGYKTVSKKVRNPEFLEILSEIHSEDKFEISSIHGDLGSENILARQPMHHVSDFTIIDWEFFALVAPALTDKVGFWLGQNHRRIKGPKRNSLRLLTKSFLANFRDECGGIKAASIALLYLHIKGIDLASELIMSSE